VASGKRALFLDWGGTLVQTRDNRTLVDADGNPIIAQSRRRARVLNAAA
jgi:hypothetical protein